MVAALGVEPREGEDVVLVAVDPEGRVSHYTLQELADHDVDEADALYLASGTFGAGTVTRWRGRTAEHVARVLWLLFDCDLVDWEGVTDKAEREQRLHDLHALPDAELDALIARQQTDVEEVFARANVPIHRLDITGYGLCAYVHIDEADQQRVTDCRDAHKLLIAHLNEVAGYRLVDPQASDAGTRITRVPDSLNTKGAIPRRVRTLYRHDASAPLGGRPQAQRPPTPLIPKEGPGLSQPDADAIMKALTPSWTLGQKHAMGLAVAGILAKAGVPEAQAAAIVERLSAHDAKPWDRAAAVRRSYDRVRTGLAVKGFTALQDLVPAETLAFVDGILTRYKRATTPTLIIHDGEPDPAARAAKRVETRVSYDPPPAVAFHGWFKAYLDLVEPTTEAPDAFHLGAALTLAGAMIGRRVRTEYASDPLYANLYTVLIGPSGSSRKDTAIKRALTIPQLQLGADFVQTPFHVVTDVASAEGLVTILKDNPNTLLYVTELSTLKRNASRKATQTILPRLIEAWDTPAVLQNLTKNQPIQAVRPYLSVVAATQPGTLALEMTEEDIHSGFGNRWLYVVGAGKPARPTPPPLDKEAAWKLYGELAGAIRRYGEGKVLPVDPGTQERWDAWYVNQQGESGRNEDEDAMRVRHATLIRKIALIYAVADGAAAISDDHLAAAIALVDWMWTHVRALLKEWGVGVDVQIEERIKAALRKHEAMPRRLLQMRTAGRRWSARDFAAVFRAMQENGTLAVDAEGNVALAGGG